jgi:hypothetical protein
MLWRENETQGAGPINVTFSKIYKPRFDLLTWESDVNDPRYNKKELGTLRDLNEWNRYKNQIDHYDCDGKRDPYCSEQMDNYVKYKYVSDVQKFKNLAPDRNQPFIEVDNRFVDTNAYNTFQRDQNAL